jgi:hypothetical protein
VAAKVALDVRPAHLPALGIEVAEAVPAVRDHDPRVAGADQLVELLAVAVLGDLQEHRIRGGRGPQRAAVTARAPAGLIDVHRALVEHPVVQVQIRASQRLGCALADRVRGPGRERHPEQITRQLGDPAAGDPICRGQRHDRRLQPGPERRSGKL